MAFTDDVIQRTKQLEKLLIDRGGVGRGLQERATSLRDELDAATLSRIKSIATTRDRLLHDVEYEFEGNEQEFLQSCDDTIKQLNRRVASSSNTTTAILPPPPPRKTPLGEPAQPLAATKLKFVKPRKQRDPVEVPAALWVLLVIVVLGAAGWWYHRTHPDFVRRLLARKVEMPKTMSVQEAQREALKRYPDLGVNGSKLNIAYVARYKAYQQTRPEFFRNPEWPLVLADEVAKQ